MRQVGALTGLILVLAFKAAITIPLFQLGALAMNPTIGLILVIGFPLVLCTLLWVFGKVSVRPE